MDLPAHPCTASASAQTVRSLGRCIPTRPSNLLIRVSPTAPSCRRTVCLHPSTFMTRIPDRPIYVPRTDDMAPRQGLASGLLGRRTRSLGSGGSGRCVTDETAWP
jgi:hypothetical protein